MGEDIKNFRPFLKIHNFPSWWKTTKEEIIN